MRYFILFATFFTCIPYFTAQASVTEEQLAKFKSGIQEFLDYQKDVNDLFGSITVKYDGEITIKPQDEQYIVTLPKISLIGTEKENTNNVDVGTIIVNASPDENGFSWNLSFTLPSTITVKAENEPDLIVHTTPLASTGVFNTSLGYFSKLDINYSDISAMEDGKDIGLNIKKLNFLADLVENAEKKLSGPSGMIIEGLSAGETDSAFHIGKLSLIANIKDLEPITLADYKAKIMKHKKIFDDLKSIASDPKKPPEIESQAVMNMMFDLYNWQIGSLDFDIKGENIGIDTFPSIEDDDAASQIENKDQIEKFNIGSILLGTSFSGIGSDDGELSLRAGFSDASMQPMDPQYEGVMPTDLNVNISTKKMPLNTLYTLTRNTANSAVSNPRMAEMAGMGLLLRLPAILAQAGSTFALNNNYIKGGLYNAQIDGSLMADLTSVALFSGNFKGKFDGLDELLKKIKDNVLSKDSYAPQEYNDIATTLENIKNYAKSRQSKDGKSSYEYDIVLTQEGLVQINGQIIDFSNSASTDRNTGLAIPMDGGATGGSAPDLNNEHIVPSSTDELQQ